MTSIEEYMKRVSFRLLCKKSQVEQACRDGRVDVVEYVVTTFNLDVCEGFLNYAAKCGNLEIVKFLVSHNANINEMSRQSYTTPVYQAIINNQVEVVAYLLENGAILDDVCLEFSAKLGLEMLRLCIAYGESCLPLGQLLCYACKVGSLENVKFLVSKGADVNFQDDAPLRISAQMGNLKVVKYLCSKYETSTYNVAVRYASSCRHFELVHYLVTLGADRSLISNDCNRYVDMYNRTQERAQKKIYFWWIPICYSLDHPSGCGKRMRLKNWEKTLELLMTQ